MSPGTSILTLGCVGYLAYTAKTQGCGEASVTVVHIEDRDSAFKSQGPRRFQAGVTTTRRGRSVLSPSRASQASADGAGAR
ncbi:hypothetical protein B0H10DRAFT_2212250 [Mycena sp. CBHHK59/15]|nr:hypothetical protein B0H10DRAFT_2220669 [Mycena sp. CBHHK59/15]KAJ6624841.1 hypothetical protein B0H10DRAFT_2212250 [Mycena sp. CBHHK59/15]